MSKLLHAGLERIRKDKLFWVGNLVLALFCVLICVEQYRNMIEDETSYPLDNFIFGSFMLIGIVLSVFISLFVGKEYSDGTIRNKIIVGHKRTQIYLSNFLLSAFAAVSGVLISMLATIIIGIPLFGFFKMELSHLLLLTGDYLLAAVAYASVFQMISMVCQNKANAAVADVFLAFVFIFIGLYLYQNLIAPEMIEGAQLTASGEIRYIQEPNPYYLSGFKREIYQFFLDFLPSGQAMQLAQGEILHPYRLPVYSVIIIAVSNLAGVLFFRKKDLK